MNTLLFILFILFILSGGKFAEATSYKSLQIAREYPLTVACPDSNTINHSILVDFLTKSIWAEERAETSTESLDISQIEVLTDTNDSSLCTVFTSTYLEAISEENSPGEKAYSVTYYKVGSFYFVVISIRQPANEDYIATGINYLDVYDMNQNLIKGYAF